MTIYALSTGPGLSGLAVIRISGKDKKKIIKLTKSEHTQAKSCNFKKFKKSKNLS